MHYLYPFSQNPGSSHMDRRMDIIISIAKVDLMQRGDALASVAKNIGRSMSRFIALYFDNSITYAY